MGGKEPSSPGGSHRMDHAVRSATNLPPLPRSGRLKPLVRSTAFALLLAMAVLTCATLLRPGTSEAEQLQPTMGGTASAAVSGLTGQLPLANSWGTVGSLLDRYSLPETTAPEFARKSRALEGSDPIGRITETHASTVSVSLDVTLSRTSSSFSYRERVPLDDADLRKLMSTQETLPSLIDKETDGILFDQQQAADFFVNSVPTITDDLAGVSLSATATLQYNPVENGKSTIFVDHYRHDVEAPLVLTLNFSDRHPVGYSQLPNSASANHATWTLTGDWKSPITIRFAPDYLGDVYSGNPAESTADSP